VLVVLVMTNLLVPDVFVTVKVLAACTVCTANNVINNNNKEIIFFILIALLNLQLPDIDVASTSHLRSIYEP